MVGSSVIYELVVQCDWYPETRSSLLPNLQANPPSDAVYSNSLGDLLAHATLVAPTFKSMQKRLSRNEPFDLGTVSGIQLRKLCVTPQSAQKFVYEYFCNDTCKPEREVAVVKSWESFQEYREWTTAYLEKQTLLPPPKSNGRRKEVLAVAVSAPEVEVCGVGDREFVPSPKMKYSRPPYTQSSSGNHHNHTRTSGNSRKNTHDDQFSTAHVFGVPIDQTGHVPDDVKPKNIWFKCLDHYMSQNKGISRFQAAKLCKGHLYDEFKRTFKA
jgi:hypothetical protein